MPRSRPITFISSRLLLAGIPALLAVSRLPAEDGAPAAPAKAAKTIDGARPAPGQLVIPWDGSELKGRVQIIKRLYRLKKSNQWGKDRLPRLCELAIATKDKQLVKYATWYQALIAGHEGNTQLAVERLKEAIRLGYRNALEMEESEELKTVRELPETREILDALKVSLKDRMVRNFRVGIEAGFKAGKDAGGKPWNRELRALDGSAFWEEGRPSIAVLTRTYHDGLESHLPNLVELGEKFPVKLLFYQYDPSQDAPSKQAKAYQEKLKARGLSVPCSVIGRKEYRELVGLARAHFAAASAAKERSDEDEEDVFREGLPLTFFLDESGTPLFSHGGVPADWEAAALAEEFAKVAPPPVKPPPDPERPPAEPEAKPEEPPKPASEKPAPKADADPEADGKKPAAEPETKPETKPEKPAADPETEKGEKAPADAEEKPPAEPEVKPGEP